MCKAFAGSPAPTPAMMDVQAEQIDEGKAGFIYGAAPKPLPRPNKRLDAKPELFDYERWNSDWARNATDPASYAPEYESYIRQIEPTHGHDPGLIYARDFAQKVEKRRGKGGEFVQSLLARLADRPDLQRAFLGGEVPHHPPQGSFRPGGEAGVKDWIDQDRIANGIAPKYSKAAQAAQTVQAVGQIAPILANVAGAVSGAAGRTGKAEAPTEGPAPEPDYKNLLEYVNNFGFPGDEAPAQQTAQAPTAQTPPVVTVPLPPLHPVPSVAEEAERLDEADRQRRVQETIGQEEVTRSSAGDPDDPRFTPGIWTGTRHATEADTYPPPPAPVPPRPLQASRTETGWIVGSGDAVLDRARENGGWIGIGPDGRPSRECVGLVQAAVPGIGHTSTWRPGERIAPADPMRPIIQPGTPIATFEPNARGELRYPNRQTGNHAGIFDGYGEQGGREGIWVIDQYNRENRGEADRRFYAFEPDPRQGGYRAGQFSVILPNNQNRR